MRCRLDQVYRPAPEITCAVVSGYGVLLDCVEGDYYELEPVSLCVWEALDGRREAAAAAAEVAARFEVDEETARRDVQPFLDALLAARLIEPVAAG